ncbi:MAG: hypothetical protein LC539_19400, partial [Candidatus Thiodiazotropha sp.]|nr:hypothetical protein [Candidatus Thiodiazotropha sp.]
RKARRVYSLASRLPGTNRLGFQPSLALSERFLELLDIGLIDNRTSLQVCMSGYTITVWEEAVIHIFVGNGLGRHRGDCHECRSQRCMKQTHNEILQIILLEAVAQGDL